MNQLTFPLVIFGALGDSINPCAIAVLIFLVTFLLNLKVKGRKFLLIGLVYIFFVYITYLLAGIGLMTVVRSLKVTQIVYQLSAVLVILAGLINIKDVFWEGKGISLKIPKSTKPIIQKYVQTASVPAAILLGILVSLFELPCTGGIYIAIIGLLAEHATKMEGVGYLMLYNLIFVLPLVGILLLAFFSLSQETLNVWRKKNKTTMRLIMGIVMVMLGSLMLLS